LPYIQCQYKCEDYLNKKKRLLCRIKEVFFQRKVKKGNKKAAQISKLGEQKQGLLNVEYCRITMATRINMEAIIVYQVSRHWGRSS